MRTGLWRLLVGVSLALWIVATLSMAGPPGRAFEWWLRYRLFPAGLTWAAVIGTPWALWYAVRWIVQGFRR